MRAPAQIHIKNRKPSEHTSQNKTQDEIKEIVKQKMQPGPKRNHRTQP